MNGNATYYIYLDSPIGKIFVAGAGPTVSRISFTRGHQIRRPQPGWIEDREPLQDAAEQLEQYFAGERRRFDDLPPWLVPSRISVSRG